MKKRNIGLMLVMSISLILSTVSLISADDSSDYRLGWTEDFDSYTLGQILDGTPDDGGWKGWNNVAAGAAPVTNTHFLSSPHAVEIEDTGDIVREFSGYTTGQWIFSAWVYVPTGFTGESYFILLNTYSDNGTQLWSTQVRFDAALGVVESEHEAAQLPLILDQWVEIRVMINLDNDTQYIYYNDQFLTNKSWTEGVSSGGALNIGAVDLFANGASPVYYDDLSLISNAFNLTVNVIGDGTVTKNPDQPVYTYGTPVQLTAVPATDWAFSHWSGDLTGDTNPDTITMNGNKTVVAHFIQLTVTANIPLYTGWNMITVPLQNSWTAEDLGTNITGCTLVLKYDVITHGFITHVVGVPANNFLLEDGVGYFVFVTTGSTFSYTALPISSVSVHLYEEWNLIGWYHGNDTMADSLGENITGCTLVLMFDAQTEAFTTCVVGAGGDFVVKQGMGLFVFVTSESDWHGEG